MKKYLLFLMAIMFATVARAADGDTFTYEGLNYTILSEADHTVEVGRNREASGEVTIPSFVTMNGSRYVVTSIGDKAFDRRNIWNSKLTSVTIPNSVTEIGEEAFRDCSSLTSVTIPNSVTKIGFSAFYGCSSLTSVTIPNSVTSISAYTFSGCSSLTSVTIPNSVTSISWCAFEGCSSLTSVTIPNSVTSIDWSAFWGCSSLTSVTIPNSVTKIGGSAFYGCSSLTSVTIPKSVTSIGTGPFAGCTNLNEIIVEAGNEYYCSDNGTLYNYNKTILIQCPGAKTEFEIPNSVTEIGVGAFSGFSGLTSVIIPNSVTSIGYNAFSNCSSLTSVTIPNSVTSIGSSVFSGCSSFTSVTIPNSVTSIDSQVFKNCSNLTSVTIPNSVTSIGFAAFSGCSSLRTIIDLNPTPQGVDTREDYLSFEGVPSDAVVYIPKGSYISYMVKDGWIQFSDFSEMGAFDVTISASTLELAKDETAELTVTVVKDDDVTVGDHEWVSFNPEVATVEDGKVTAVAPGTTTINYTEYTTVAGIAVPHTVACEVTVAVTTGIRDIVEEDDVAPADVFNLNGYHVLHNATEVEINALPAGIYIVRQGSTAKKIAVK